MIQKLKLKKHKMMHAISLNTKDYKNTRMQDNNNTTNAWNIMYQNGISFSML